MIGTRYENYKNEKNQLPFVLNVDINRNSLNLSRERNWHENIEIQFCTDGQGEVLLDGERIAFNKNDIIFVNSNVIHYTFTKTSLTYSCLIISTDFCKQMGIDYDELYFSPIIKNQAIANVFLEIKKTYLFDDLAFRVAKLNKLLLELIIELVEHHIERKNNYDKNKNFEAVKQAVVYIRKNYSQKLTLDMIAKYVMIDKYALCREFKTFTGQTVFENINKYRCLNAAEYLKSGYSVADAATTCGFKNLSFFTKTFKKYIGILPSKYKCTYNYSQP